MNPNRETVTVETFSYVNVDYLIAQIATLAVALKEYFTAKGTLKMTL